MEMDAAAPHFSPGVLNQDAPPVELRPFVTPLHVPPSLRLDGTLRFNGTLRSSGTGAPIQIQMRQFRHRAHRDLPPVTMWGYNGMWPGPTFEARRGELIRVQWNHRLPSRHLLPIDHTIHGAGRNVPHVRTVTHVHGARVMPDSDGYPDAWVSSDGIKGPVQPAAPCTYPNEQRAMTLWYHDHAMGITRLNIYAGLAGMYLIRDSEEESLNLPKAPYEIPLLIQDRSFSADGTLLYPPARGGTHPAWMQEFFANAICVNGKVAPFLEVEPRKYRFRFVNGSNARFYHLKLGNAGEPHRNGATNATTNGTRVDAPPFIQIGADCGLLPAPVRLASLVIAPGERFDVVLDFSEFKGANLALVNDAPAPYARGGEIVPSDVLLFKVVKPLAGIDESRVPDLLSSFAPLDLSRASRERVLALTEMDRAADGYTMVGLLGQKCWSDPITEDPKAGSTEIWSFANTTGDVHPIHIHLVQFQVINRQSFDTGVYLQTGKVVLTGRPLPPEGNEFPGWKDTVKTYAGYITRVIARFDLPAGAAPKPGDEFRYVWHCHVLEHEDNEMMRPYKIVA